MPFNTQEFVAGFLSGMVNVSVGHPLDTIKVLYQTNSPLPRSILPYYRGFAVPLGLVPVENAIVFGVYHKSRPYFEKDAIYGHALAGGLAGLAYALFASPMELAKIRLQTRKADEVRREAASVASCKMFTVNEFKFSPQLVASAPRPQLIVERRSRPPWNLEGPRLRKGNGHHPPKGHVCFRCPILNL